MRSLNSSKKNYKFPLGAIFAILAGITVVINLIVYIVHRTIFSVFLFQQSGFASLLASTTYVILFIIEHSVLMIALLALAICLMLKKRKKLLIALPIAMTISCFFAISSYLFDMLNSIRGNIDLSFILQSLTCVFAYVLIAISCLLLAVIILPNCGKNRNKLSFMSWIAPISAIIGHIILFISSAINLSSVLTLSISIIENPDYFLYALSIMIGSIRSTLYLAVFGILFALTVFFTARWIINPYKKSVQIDEADSQQITE